MTANTQPIGILGLGLAGAFLARALERAGVSFYWADEALPGAASTMAPGIINPLAGRKFKLNSDFASAQAETLAAFEDIEHLLGETFWHPTPLVRLLENEGQREELSQRKMENPDWIGSLYEPRAHGDAIRDPYGSFETLKAGWLDVPGLVAGLRRHYAGQRLPGETLKSYCGRVVDCRGWRCALDPHWSALPWKNARGEVMEVSLEGELPRQLWNGGGWLQPIGEERWRVGATYAWSNFEAPPSLIARSELVAKLQRWMRLPFRIHDQAAGVRAVVIDYRPVLGALPQRPDYFIFSGLGSHGAMQAPLFSRQLTSHLVEGTPLDRDVNVARFANG